MISQSVRGVLDYMALFGNLSFLGLDLFSEVLKLDGFSNL